MFVNGFPTDSVGNEPTTLETPGRRFVKGRVERIGATAVGVANVIGSKVPTLVPDNVVGTPGTVANTV